MGSQTMSPCVKTRIRVSIERVLSQCWTSLLTHVDCADSGEASTIRNSDSESARSIEAGSDESGASDAVSRKIRTARSRYQGLAKL